MPGVGLSSSRSEGCVGVSSSGPSAKRMKITPLITLRYRIPCSGLSNQLRSVNQYIQGLIDDENVVITLTGPEKEGLSYPTPAELLKAYEAACLLPVEPYREEVSNEPLIPELPEPGRITDTREDPRFGATVMTLSNGIRVVLKPTELKKDEILMTASRPGGSSVFGKDDAYNLKLFNDVNEIGVRDRLEVTLEIAEISGQDAGCDLNAHGTYSIFLLRRYDRV